MSEPIEVFFWPTPNGFKITIMLEECAELQIVIYPIIQDIAAAFNYYQRLSCDLLSRFTE